MEHTLAGEANVSIPDLSVQKAENKLSTMSIPNIQSALAQRKSLERVDTHKLKPTSKSNATNRKRGISRHSNGDRVDQNYANTVVPRRQEILRRTNRALPKATRQPRKLQDAKPKCDNEDDWPEDFDPTTDILHLNSLQKADRQAVRSKDIGKDEVAEKGATSTRKVVTLPHYD